VSNPKLVTTTALATEPASVENVSASQGSPSQIVLFELARLIALGMVCASMAHAVAKPGGLERTVV
jgi:hypothetical protein